jgi:predicted amidohydrolase
MCDYIDHVFQAAVLPTQVRLFCFPEFGIGGHYSFQDTTADVKRQEAISIPGVETEALAARAKKYNCYIAAVNNENDPAYPDNFFNTAFIINPKGKIILKYRKMNIAFGLNPHDILDNYVNPITGVKDYFPVVDTELGRLGCFICGDLGMPEIPRIYALKGCEVLLHLSSGYSWEMVINLLRARAVDNTIYMVHENWGSITISERNFNGTPLTFSSSRGGGGSCIIDYNGDFIVRAEGNTPQVVLGMVDVARLRREREQWRRPNPFGQGGNFLANTRTELYAPFYSRSIYPPNTRKDGSVMAGPHDDSSRERRQMALANLKKFHDFYSEESVK